MDWCRTAACGSENFKMRHGKEDTPLPLRPSGTHLPATRHVAVTYLQQREQGGCGLKWSAHEPGEGLQPLCKCNSQHVARWRKDDAGDRILLRTGNRRCCTPERIRRWWRRGRRRWRAGRAGRTGRTWGTAEKRCHGINFMLGERRALHSLITAPAAARSLTAARVATVGAAAGWGEAA